MLVCESLNSYSTFIRIELIQLFPGRSSDAVYALPHMLPIATLSTATVSDSPPVAWSTPVVVTAVVDDEAAQGVWISIEPCPFYAQGGGQVYGEYSVVYLVSRSPEQCGCSVCSCFVTINSPPTLDICASPTNPLCGLQYVLYCDHTIMAWQYYLTTPHRQVYR